MPGHQPFGGLEDHWFGFLFFPFSQPRPRSDVKKRVEIVSEVTFDLAKKGMSGTA